MMKLLSERPGSNRRHSAWKADALPTELLSPLIPGANIDKPLDIFQEKFTTFSKNDNPKS